jgi:hypothetical protein
MSTSTLPTSLDYPSIGVAVVILAQTTEVFSERSKWLSNENLLSIQQNTVETKEIKLGNYLF